MKIPIGAWLVEAMYSTREGSPDGELPKSRVDLTDEETLLLKGVDRPEIQKLVRRAEVRLDVVGRHPELPARVACLLGTVVAELEQERRLGYRWTSVRSCPTCNRCAGFAKFKRGINAGRNNTKKPLTLSGFCLRAPGQIHWQNTIHLGGCRACWDIIRPALRTELAAFAGPVDIPTALVDALATHTEED